MDAGGLPPASAPARTFPVPRTHRRTRFGPATNLPHKEEVALTATTDGGLLLPPNADSEDSSGTNMDVDSIPLQPPIEHQPAPAPMGRGQRVPKKHSYAAYVYDIDSIDAHGPSKRGKHRHTGAANNANVQEATAATSQQAPPSAAQPAAATIPGPARSVGAAARNKRARDTGASHAAANEPSNPAASRSKRLRRNSVPSHAAADGPVHVMLDGNANVITEACEGANALVSISLNEQWREIIILQPMRCTTKPPTAGAAAAEQRSLSRFDECGVEIPITYPWGMLQTRPTSLTQSGVARVPTFGPELNARGWFY